MSGINKVIQIGRLTRDPEMKIFPSGDKQAQVSIANSTKWKEKGSGKPMEHTEYHRVVFNGRLAEVVYEFLSKGSNIYIEGELRHESWDDKNSGVKQYATKIVVTRLEMLGGGSKNEPHQEHHVSEGDNYPSNNNGTLADVMDNVIKTNTQLRAGTGQRPNKPATNTGVSSPASYVSQAKFTREECNKFQISVLDPRHPDYDIDDDLPF